MSVAGRRRLAAIMFADMAGYTALMQKDEGTARSQRDRFIDSLVAAVLRYHGEILQHFGDGALTVFDSAVEAVEAAVALQKELRREPPVPVRIGVHSGDIVHDADGIYGDGVNVASRIEPLGAPGGVLVSGKVYDEIKNHPSLSAEPRGEVRLKNVKRPMRVFAITTEGLSVPSAEEVRSKAWSPAPADSTAVVAKPAARALSPPDAGASLFHRVEERSLVQWGFAYLAGAWAFLEAAGFAEGAFDWPASVSRALVIAAAIGLPLTLVVAWYHGEKGRQRVSGPELLLIGLLLAIGGGVMASIGPDAVDVRPVPAPLSLAPALAELPSIAVLPFENLSGTPETEPFAVGIHDDVLTQLSKIGGLRVISRTSVLGYRDTGLTVPEIAGELGVATVLEGGVQRVNDRIRMNAQLIDAETDTHLWAERFDTVYTVENVFAIQSAIAAAIAAALEAVLTPVELAAVHDVPTDDREAYELYLSGIEHLNRPGWAASELARAQRDFEGATEADPGFAEAYAHLAVVHFLFFRVSYDTSLERLELIRETAERSLELDPDLPGGHLSLSHYYGLAGQMDRALAELAIAGEGLPNDPWIPVGLAMVRQRQGAWGQAVRDLERAAHLDPRNPEFSFLLADTYAKMRRWEEAERQLDRTLSLAPGMTQAALQQTLLRLFRDGQVDAMLAAIDQIPAAADFGEQPAFFTWWGRFLARDFVGSEAPLERLGPHDTGWPVPYSPAVLRGLSRWHDSRVESARMVVEADLPSLEKDARERADQPGPHQVLGIAYAILGRNEDAVREGRLASELLPISRDAYDGPYVLTDLARIYAILGEVDLAIDGLEILLSVPCDVTVALLAMDPVWDTLRDVPRFRTLVGG